MTDNEREYLDIPKHTFIEEREEYYTGKIRRLKILCFALMSLCVLLCGVIGGGVYLYRQMSYDAAEKFERVLNIMENEWFFADGIDNVHERLVDQAMIGMTSNPEDPHTAYMTREEQEAFVQGINRNFVGIGVQFFMVGDGVPMVSRVLKGTPAEEAGVQPGDIIYSVDGALVEGLSSDAIVELVRGEPGSVVHMQFKRGDEFVQLNITRREIATTVFGRLVDDTAIIEISQFGTTTASELKVFLEEYGAAGIDKLIIDLRDNGGGYVSSLQQTAGLFLESGAVALIEQDHTGKETVETVRGTRVWNLTAPMVLLVNEHTASAAEAFTLAMREQRVNVTVVGTRTYGKGTAQFSVAMGDGSYLKYTYAKWLSPGHVWVNNEGIEPDETVELPYILNIEAYEFTGEDDVYPVDSVGKPVEISQYALEYLGYAADRTDGYYSLKTEAALRAFAADHDLGFDGVLDEELMTQLIQAVTYDWMTSDEHDTQLLRALEIVHE